jgi:hypothetical protein
MMMLLFFFGNQNTLDCNVHDFEFFFGKYERIKNQMRTTSFFGKLKLTSSNNI